MEYRRLDEHLSASAQLDPAQVGEAARAGFRTIICNRPDGEEAGQPSAAAVRAQAEWHGLSFAHVPIESGKPTDGAVEAMRQALDELPGPALAYCRTGARSAKLWELARPDGGTDGGR